MKLLELSERIIDAQLRLEIAIGFDQPERVSEHRVGVVACESQVGVAGAFSRDELVGTVGAGIESSRATSPCG